MDNLLQPKRDPLHLLLMGDPGLWTIIGMPFRASLQLVGQDCSGSQDHAGAAP